MLTPYNHHSTGNNGGEGSPLQNEIDTAAFNTGRLLLAGWNWLKATLFGPECVPGDRHYYYDTQGDLMICNENGEAELVSEKLSTLKSDIESLQSEIDLIDYQLENLELFSESIEQAGSRISTSRNTIDQGFYAKTEVIENVFTAYHSELKEEVGFEERSEEQEEQKKGTIKASFKRK